MAISIFASRTGIGSRIVCATVVPVLFLLLLPGARLAAQGYVNTSFEERNKYPDQLFSLRGGFGFNKYDGDFNGHMSTNHVSLGAAYSILPSLSIGLGADFGSVAYTRSARSGDGSIYKYQFGSSYGDRTSTYSSFHLDLMYTLWRGSRYNAYAVGGAGVLLYSAADYSDGSSTYRPKTDLPAMVDLPLGLGLDYLLFGDLALNMEYRFHLLMSDDIDAYDQYNLTLEALRKKNAKYSGYEQWDNFQSMSVGFKYFLFTNPDYDADLLSNAEEEKLYTDPYNPDTDGDGLSDYEEVRLYGSSPLMADTDGDLLGDYDEVQRYRTHPALVDSDGDGLTDYAEITTYATVPTEKDTDGDGLTDAQELELRTDPRNLDSDYDGLSDYAEVRVHRTDPLHADTDRDGVFDYNEVITYHTDPRLADTDGDGLSDYEEIAYHQTDPLRKDTDSDGLEDVAEIVDVHTNPLDRDTDGDGIPDAVDACPQEPENYNGVTDGDGCPDGTQPGSAQFAGLPNTPAASAKDTGEGAGPEAGFGRTPRSVDEASILGPSLADAPATHAGGDAGEGAGPETGFGRGNGAGTGPAAGLGHGFGAGTGPEAGLGGGFGAGTGPEAGFGRTAPRVNAATITGAAPASEDMLARFNSYRDRAVQHVTPSAGGAPTWSELTAAAIAAKEQRASLVSAKRASMRAQLPVFTEESVEEGRLLLLTNVHFEFDRDELRPEYRAELQEKVAVFTAYPDMVVEIRGHTDAEGTESYNENLSVRRALAVKNFFVQQGVNPRRLKAKGFGACQPLMNNGTDEGRAVNRRVELFVERLGTHRKAGANYYTENQNASSHQ